MTLFRFDYSNKSALDNKIAIIDTTPNLLISILIYLICRDITIEYAKQVQKLGITLFELLSEALGLKTDHLLELDCAKGQAFLLHYYPACPEPHLTMGTSKHSDPDYLTILLQDHVGGLQILHQDRWIDVPPLPGALVINIGDLLQARVFFSNISFSFQCSLHVYISGPYDSH